MKEYIFCFNFDSIETIGKSLPHPFHVHLICQFEHKRHLIFVRQFCFSKTLFSKKQMKPEIQ